jgi:hypothetical protein
MSVEPEPLATLSTFHSHPKYGPCFGVNLVMHALTGNYKDDMVHMPDIMQRLRR